MTRLEVQPMEPDVALSTFNAMLGAWLIGSSFLWPHSTALRVDSIAVGVACIAVALLSDRLPAARWLFVPLSGWAVLSPYLLPLRDPCTAVNLVAMGVVMLLAPLTTRWLGQDDPREIVRNPAEA